MRWASAEPAKRTLQLAALAAGLCALGVGLHGQTQSATSFVIVNARLVDGTGAPVRSGGVRVADGRIVEVGAITPAAGERIVDARGLVLAPGFIDPHNHSTDGLLTEPLAPTQISQGITTVVVGQDGSSPWPIGEYLARLRAEPPALNVMTAVGHATVRRQVMGDDYKREARLDEVARMEALVEQGMREGAVALSSGLEYEWAATRTPKRWSPWRASPAVTAGSTSPTSATRPIGRSRRCAR